MKIFFVLFLLFVSCKTTELKKVKTRTTEKTIATKDSNQQQYLLATLKNPNTVKDVKSLIVNSGLTWNSLEIDDNSLKVASIAVPSDKKSFWIKKLLTTGVFSDVTLASKDAIHEKKEILKNTLVKISKTQCRGNCPSYELTLLNNGTLYFKGIKNVVFIGSKSFLVKSKNLKTIKALFAKTEFNIHPKSYIDSTLKDIQSTFITYNNKQIEITLWHKVPKELVLAYKTVEDILYEKKLI